MKMKRLGLMLNKALRFQFLLVPPTQPQPERKILLENLKESLGVRMWKEMFGSEGVSQKSNIPRNIM